MSEPLTLASINAAMEAVWNASYRPSSFVMSPPQFRWYRRMLASVAIRDAVGGRSRRSFLNGRVDEGARRPQRSRLPWRQRRARARAAVRELWMAEGA